jgi:hypothetical protein
MKEVSFTSKEFLEKQFEFYSKPQHWYKKAIELRQAARTLYRCAQPSLRLYEQARRKAIRELNRGVRNSVAIRRYEPDLLIVYMLYGLALENLLKGLLVARGAGPKAGRALPKYVTDHRLPKLIRRAGIEPGREEEQLLHWLTAVVTWKARYPVPKSPNDDLLPDMFEDVTLLQSQALKRDMEEMFHKVECLVKPHAPQIRIFPSLVSVAAP